MTKAEIAAKVEWEGGVGEAILGYGLASNNLPDDTPTDVKSAWMALERIGWAIERIENWLEAT